ncbi:MAG: bifunctional folylpolyglutamate synthase/dihydrofolate synthase [Lachnospiraceae bacterium]
MTYESAMDIIEKASMLGSVLGLDSIKRLLDELGNPQEHLQVIHIAGTNGKGSILAYLDSIYREAGYHVGRYISPSIFEYRERFQIDGEYISEEKFTDCMETVWEAVKRMQKQGFESPTVYEMETAISFLYFLKEKVDVVLLETGLGGRLDATNVVSKPLCEIIASISRDHMQFLGETLEEIAYEKAGIIKQHTPVVVYPNPEEIMGVLEAQCREKHASLVPVSDCESETDSESLQQRFVWRDHWYVTQMLGKHQVKNAATALTCVDVLQSKLPVSTEQMQKGIEKATWAGRFEILQKNPYLIRDGAHNEDAARVLAETLREYFGQNKKYFVMGMFADKEYQKVMEIMAPLADKIYTVTPDNPRALSASELAKQAEKYCKDVTVAEDVPSALSAARKEADENSVILAFGSLSFIGALS